MGGTLELNDYVVVDLEMTGLRMKEDKIIEIGAVKVRNHQVVDTYGTLVNSGRTISEKTTSITGISQEMVETGMQEDEAIEGLLDFIGELPIVGHNVIFDYSFLAQWAVNHKKEIPMCGVDTLKLARRLLPGPQSKKLEDLCTYFQIQRERGHRALDDAIETQKLYEIFLEMMKQQKLEPEPPKPLLVKVKKQTKATAHQLQRLEEFRKLYGITEPLELEALTRSQASRLMDQYRSRFGAIKKEDSTE